MTLGCIVWLQKESYLTYVYVFTHGFFVPPPVPALHDVDLTSLKLGQGLKLSSKPAIRIMGIAAASGKNGSPHATLKNVCTSFFPLTVEIITAGLLSFTGATG